MENVVLFDNNKTWRHLMSYYGSKKQRKLIKVWMDQYCILHLLHEEDKRDTDKGEENFFSTDISKYAYWRDFFCILLAKFSGRCQQDYAIFAYTVCCFRNFLQLIKPRNSLWTGSLVKGRFPSVTSLWTLPAVVRPFQLEPVHSLAREKQLLCLQISTLRR